MASLKPFHRRSSDLRHPIEDEFAQIARGADFGRRGDSVAAAPMYMLMDKRTTVGASGVAHWEYRGKYRDGVSSDWVVESEALDNFTPLQLDTFHAWWKLNPPSCKQTSTPSPVRLRKRAALSRSEALVSLPIGTRVIRPCMVNNETTNRVGQVYDFCSPFWRVRFDDNDCEELTISEVKKGPTRG